MVFASFISGCVQPEEIEGKEKVTDEEIEEFENPDRDAYGTGIFLIDENRNVMEKPIKEAFVLLPGMPGDFAFRVNEMLEIENVRKFKEFTEDLDKSYYKQPEFLPTFESAGLPYWQNPRLEIWGVMGWGIFPADQHLSVSRGREVVTHFYIHSAWGIETFQGVRLYPFFPEQNYNSSGNLYNEQNAEATSKYFEVEVSPENFLLEPTYSIISENWIYRVDVKIGVSGDAEAGTYVLGFNGTSPSPELNERWGSKYERYFVSGGVSDLGRPRARINITVE